MTVGALCSELAGVLTTSRRTATKSDFRTLSIKDSPIIPLFRFSEKWKTENRQELEHCKTKTSRSQVDRGSMEVKLHSEGEGKNKGEGEEEEGNLEKELKRRDRKRQ